MGSTIDTILKGAIAASTIIAAASVAYYFLQYLPQRDFQLDNLRQSEQARAEREKQTEQYRLNEEKRASAFRYAMWWRCAGPR